MTQLPIELINHQIDYWLEKEADAQRALDYCHRQLDIHIGMKVLRLVGAEEPVTRAHLSVVPDIIA